jgi:prepilin-type processing-associated H-X9-DG protein
METETSADLFNSLLKESMEIENVIIEDDNDICLISGEKLKDKYITLNCNHKFNYDALFHEVKQWKSNSRNRFYSAKNRFHFNCIVCCPYCRQITKGLLPYYSELNGIAYEKTTNVNWPKCFGIYSNKCKYIFASGKKKGMCCDRGCNGLFCDGHEKHSHKYDSEGNLKIITKKPKVQIQNNFKCSHILLRGKRKGLSCGKKASCYKKNGAEQKYTYCSTHVKKYNHPEPLILDASI